MQVYTRDLSPVVQQDIAVFVIVQQTESFPVQQKLFQLLEPLQLDQMVRIFLRAPLHRTGWQRNSHQYSVLSIPSRPLRQAVSF